MYHISKEESVEIRKEMEATKNANAYSRMLSVALRGEGHKNGEIGKITGYHEDSVGKLAKIYREEGIKGLLSDGRKGGNHQNMSDEEAEKFLKGFKGAAERGEIITIGEIAKAYDEATGKERESKSTVYNFLHRYGWREITPRPKHPESASVEEIEESKKN